MVKREKEHLKNKKKKHLRRTIIWMTIMFSILIIGYILNKTKNNVFTVIAALFTLPAAQEMTQLLAIWKFQDSEIKTSEFFESIEGSYDLFHSVLLPDKKDIINFDHLIVTGKMIYCVVDQPRDITKIKKVFNEKLQAKGIPEKMITYVELSKIKNKQALREEIEKNAKQENEVTLKEYTQLMAQMMM